MDLQNSFLNEERIEKKERNDEVLTFVVNTDWDSTIPLPEATIPFPEAPIQEISSPLSKETRIYLFDLARFLASFMVVLFHYGLYHKISAYGYLGVQFFFILSGFVITISADGKTSGEFLIIRFKRIFPCYWICCTLTCIAHLHFKCRSGLHKDLGLDKYIRNMFFFADASTLVDASYWTLYVELQFYLLVAVLLSFKNWKQLMDIGICGLLVITWCHFLTIKEDWFIGPYPGSFLHHGWALSLGRAFAGVASKTRTKLNWAALILGTPLLFYLQWHDAVHRKTDPMVVMKILLAMILFFIVVPNFKFKPGKKTEKVLIFLGGVSYPLYLFHQYFFFEITTQYSLTTWQIFGIIPIACIIHEFLEKPFVSLITRCLRTTRTETGTETRTETRTETITETRTDTTTESKCQETFSNINKRISINNYGSIN